MRNIRELAEVIRTKNAGPYIVTADIITRDYDTYRAIKEQGWITPVKVARLYGIPESDVLSVIFFDEGKTIKINLRRAVTSGDVGDTDVGAMQQHAPLLLLELPV
jgi:hypothetical protein